MSQTDEIVKGRTMITKKRWQSHMELLTEHLNWLKVNGIITVCSPDLIFKCLSVSQ